MNRYTALTLWQEATLDLSSPNYIRADRFNLLNSSVDAVFSLIHGLVGNSFMRRVTITTPKVGRYSSVGITGSFDAATNQLTHASVSNGSAVVGFAITDEECKIHMRVAGTIYDCYVDTYLSPLTVRLRGYLPTVNKTVDAFTIANTVSDLSILSIASLPLNKLSTEKLSLEASVTNYVESVSIEEFKAFSFSALNNRSKMVWALENDQIMVKAGNDLTSLGTLTLHYPSMPKKLVSDDQAPDMPDGVAMTMVVLHLRSKIQKRMDDKFDDSQVLQQFLPLLKELYQAMGISIANEAVIDKVKAIL